LSFDLQGPVATAAAYQFEADWVAAGGRPVARAAVPAAVTPGVVTPDVATPRVAAFVPQHAGSRAQFVPSGPDQAEDTVHALLIDACFHVRERLLAVTPYFVPDVSLETAMRLAARRGVKIDLVLPSFRIIAWRILCATAPCAPSALPGQNSFAAAHEPRKGRGVRRLARHFRIGQSRFTQSAAHYESAVVFYGAREIDWLANWIEALIPEAQPFDPRAPSLLRDIGEGLLLTVAYQL